MDAQHPTNAGQIQTEYQKPLHLLSFSLNKSHELEFNDDALKYFVDPPQNADLNHRYKHWIKRSEKRSRLDNLLYACLRKEAHRERKRANVITWRGIMTKCALSLTSPFLHLRSLL
jgi:RAT1-interacting protein